jgi:hypothetical protein
VSDEQSEFVNRHAPAAEQYVARGPKGDQGPKGEPGARGLSSRTARAIVVLFLIVFCVGGLSLLLAASAKNSATHAVQANNKTWCAAMVLLTSHPVPKPSDPAANPSREQAYQLYTTFRTLRRQLGCG